MLLFRKCFSLKPIYLLWTISRRLTLEFVYKFIALQNKIVELSILKYLDVHDVAHIVSIFGLILSGEITHSLI